MVDVEQRSLENIAAIRIPMKRNHISEIVGADIDAPAVPIEKSNVVTTILRQKAIPVVCVALHEGQMVVRVVALVQLRATLDQSSVEIAPMRRQQAADAIEEPRDRSVEGIQLAVIGWKPGSDRGPESRLIPPLRVKAGSCADDLLALPSARRQRPCGCDQVRVSQVFKQEMPGSDIGLPLRLEAAWYKFDQHRSGHIVIECDFPATGVPAWLINPLG